MSPRVTLGHSGWSIPESAGQAPLPGSGGPWDYVRPPPARRGRHRRRTGRRPRVAGDERAIETTHILPLSFITVPYYMFEFYGSMEPYSAIRARRDKQKE